MDTGITGMGQMDATLAREKPRGFFAAHWDHERRIGRAVPPTRCCRRLVRRASPGYRCRQDAGSTLRFMESPVTLLRVHWDYEPFHTPGQGTRPTSCRPGALRGRFMESLHSFLRMLWDHEL